MTPINSSTERRQINRGFGDGLARAFEIVVTPFVVALIGFGLDHLFNTKPTFTVIFAVLGITGIFAREYFVYTAKMKSLEDKSIWGKR